MANVLVEKQYIQNAHDAVRTKLESEETFTPAELADKILSIGGGEAPTTWAEFAALSSSDMQSIYSVGDVVDIDCYWKASSTATAYNLRWVVAGYGTTKIENDDTEYPCVTLLLEQGLPQTWQFDGPEKVACDSSTEVYAEDGVYYYGLTGSSFSAANITVLGLSTGDEIPYSDYTTIYKHSLDLTASNFVNIASSGYNNYHYSTVRQWLNSDGAAGSWYSESHVGDYLASTYVNRYGFLAGFQDSDFTDILTATEVVTYANTVSDSGATITDYDKIYLPSLYEMYLVSSPVEGDRYTFITKPEDRCKSYYGTSLTNNAQGYWLRSAYRSSVNSSYDVGSNGGSYGSNCINAYYLAPACKIILQS